MLQCQKRLAKRSTGGTALRLTRAVTQPFLGSVFLVPRSDEATLLHLVEKQV